MITDYQTLQEAIIQQSHRGDMGTLIPQFIQNAEIEMYNNQVEPLKVRSMETIQTATSSTGKYMALPANYESTRGLRLSIDGGRLQYQTPEQLIRCDGTGRPVYFTIIGDEIEFNVTPDTTYTVEIQLYTRPENLSDTNTTNSILTKYPTIYLYGALAQLFLYAQDMEQMQTYDRFFVNAIKGANKSSEQGRHGPAPQMIPLTSAP